MLDCLLTGGAIGLVAAVSYLAFAILLRSLAVPAPRKLASAATFGIVLLVTMLFTESASATISAAFALLVAVVIHPPKEPEDHD